MKVYKREGRFKKKKERAKVKSLSCSNYNKEDKTGQIDSGNTKCSSVNTKPEKNTNELLIDGTFWAKQLTDHFK